MTRAPGFAAALLSLLLFSALSLPASALGGEGFSPLLVFRFGNIDALDAEDGDLAVFLKSIRNDGRFIPPMRTLVGAAIRNPTFFGVTYEAWVEGALLAPDSPGALELVWVFPVDNRDEYLAQLVNQGLNEYEGMDGVSVLREIGSDGSMRAWYLEWLPGNIAVFGARREAVTATRETYEENSAAAGLLAPPGGRGVEPDATLRLSPPRLASWQNEEAGAYWLREEIDRLVTDILAYWNPNPARARLIGRLADDLAAWPRTVESVDVNLWFEQEGVEWRLRAGGAFAERPRGRLDLLRTLPDRTALAYASPMTEATVEAFVYGFADLALGAAGGVVSQEARDTARSLYDRVRAAGLREAAWAWIAPPPGRPELGGARLLATEWDNPGELPAAWDALEAALLPDTPLSRALSQLGWNVLLRRDGMEPDAARLTILPLGGADAAPLYDAVFACGREGNRAVIAGGPSRTDGAARADVAAYRAGLADECVRETGDGTPDIRSAFTRVDAGGAGMAGIFSPVRFLQVALVEAADWQPRSADQLEPLSTQLAREMLEYGAGDAWTAAGVGTRGLLDVNGGVSWRSLSRLCAALGITESIGMD